ncbi:MAG: hydantoinase/carbamoylase family amidase [Clostridiales bacterium]|nr:hydantoinase/carbamoylase family amidase [Clostridiales bacterium]
METLQQIIQTFAAYGKTENGGISRIFGSEAYLKASLALKEYLLSEGIQSYIDSVGNVHGVYGEAEKEVLIVSHLDTVVEGGMYDGLLGVAAGIRCLLRFKEENAKLPYRVHLIATNGEEGNILGGTFGSRCLMGEYKDTLPEKTAPIVVNVETREPLRKQDIMDCRLDTGKIHSCIELHIEQGSRLEKQGRQIGVVTGIVGLWRYKITVLGNRNHSGTTMMEYREDALVKAAKVVVYCDEQARRYGQDLVATVSGVSVSPNALAVINDTVEMTLECRNLDEALLYSYIEDVKKYCEALGDIVITQTVRKAAVVCDENIIYSIESICRERNFSYTKMPSGATHDTSIFGLKVPVGMIFIPSRQGVSHNKAEFSSPEDCEAGSEVLYAYVRTKIYGMEASM